MAKQLKINIKNTQIAKAINLGGLKDKLAKKKARTKAEEASDTSKQPTTSDSPEKQPEKKKKIKARSRSAFEKKEETTEEILQPVEPEAAPVEEIKAAPPPEPTPPIEEKEEKKPTPIEEAPPPPPPAPAAPKLGPTGRHIKDLLPPPRPEKEKEAVSKKPRPKSKVGETASSPQPSKKGKNLSKFKEFKDVKPSKTSPGGGSFSSRNRRGLVEDNDGEHRWKKRRVKKARVQQEDTTIRPSSLTVRLPITIKDLANEMKLKAAELISKLFLQGVIATLNDFLDDETTVQLLGEEFSCAITIDTSEEEKIRITDKSIKEEIAQADPKECEMRAPIVAFMGHVDHGKTSIIDKIRKSNRTSGEAGSITQHIGAFTCETPAGKITFLDTPGHEAFSQMRARGADVTDIVVLVIAGDEGVRQQTMEAVQHARAANVTIVVAVNKCDKPNFNQDTVYRQLADNELLPEAWGGQTITINCSAVTGEGITELTDMLALQAEVLELKCNPSSRARGTVIESEMHKGLGPVATLLVQNGTLRLGDFLVFEEHWGKVRTMRDDPGNNLKEAPPSTPVEITGLSGIPKAGQEFIAVTSEKDAKEISEKRALGLKKSQVQKKKLLSVETLLQDAKGSDEKVLNIVLKADTQGSLEALKNAFAKIESEKARAEVIFEGIGEVNESDIELSAASKAIIVGFHTRMEPHAEKLQKEYGVPIRLHDIIYHAVDDVKDLMQGLLDKVAQENEQGIVDVKAIFKSSQQGIIAGCQVAEGSVFRNSSARLKRAGEVIWKGPIASLKRGKEDAKEVKKGLECGIVLGGWKDLQEDDILEIYETVYISQNL